MQKAALQRPVLTLVPEHRMKPEYEKRKQAAPHTLFIALGLRIEEPGYGFVMEHIKSLGEIAHFNEGVVHIQTRFNIDRTFKKINEFLVNSRVDSNTSLVVLEPKTRKAKWYLGLGASGVLNTHWRNTRTNLFVCLNSEKEPKQRFLHDLHVLGKAVRISKTMWYVNSIYSPRDAFRLLSSHLHKGDRLTVFDDAGGIKTWQTEAGRATVQVPTKEDPRPTRATIHKFSWQQEALSTFLKAG